LLRTFAGHRGWVQAVCFPVEGGYAFSAGRDGRILKWNLESGEIEAEMVHGGWVRALACAPDGKSIYAGGDDSLITCWDLTSGAKVATLRGHAASVVDLAFTPDGEYVISASLDSSLLVWTRPETLLAVYVNAAGEEVVQLHRQGQATCWTEAQEGASPQFAVDADPETYSATPSGVKGTGDLPKDLGMKWDAPVVVGAFEIDYFNAGYAPTDDGEQLQAWDGEDWYPIEAQVSKDESGANWVYTFTPVTTSRIRVFITQFSQGRTAVRELRVFPEPARLQERP